MSFWKRPETGKTQYVVCPSAANHNRRDKPKTARGMGGNGNTGRRPAFPGGTGRAQGGAPPARIFPHSTPRSCVCGTYLRTMSAYCRIFASDGACKPAKGTESRSVNAWRK